MISIHKEFSLFLDSSFTGGMQVKQSFLSKFIVTRGEELIHKWLFGR